MAWCAHRRRRSFIVPLYCSQFRVSRRYVPYPEPGGAPCPSRNSRRRVGWPGPTGLTATTRSRRRGLTCLRSVRRAPASPPLRVRPPRPSGRPGHRPVPGALRALAALAGVPRAWAPRSAVTAALRVLTAATAASAGPHRRPPSPARAGSPIRLRTNSRRSGPSGSNPRTRPRRPPRRPGRTARARRAGAAGRGAQAAAVVLHGRRRGRRGRGGARGGAADRRPAGTGVGHARRAHHHVPAG